MRRGPIAAALLALMATGSPGAGVAAGPLTFADLKGWKKDDQKAALAAFLVSCPRQTAADWQRACAAARQVGPEKGAARAFFETQFHPVAVKADGPVLFTGYYEPELRASPVRTPRFAWPIYRRPPELRAGTPWFDRSAIETRGLLRGRGLEIAWLSDPVDAFFLQVQGSGRLRMPDGSVMRVGFAAKNGQPYRSVGRELVRRGLLTPRQASMQGIRAWVKAHPKKGAEMLRLNPSYVFFRKLDLPPDLGPLGAMRLPVSAGRSLAVDPRYVPLGAPVWIAAKGHFPVARLVVAQDVGSAIKGPRRADLFLGSGTAAGRIAGRMRDRGRMIALLPLRQVAEPAVAALDTPSSGTAP